MDQVILDNNQYVAFRLNSELYAVDIRMVKTVEKKVPITRVPKVAHYIAGVINLRGEIIPVIDLAKRFNMDFIADTDDCRIMVLKIDEFQVGIIVDGVDEVIDLPIENIESATTVSSGISSNFVLGLGKIGNRIITILNFDKLTKEDEA